MKRFPSMKTMTFPEYIANRLIGWAMLTAAALGIFAGGILVRSKDAQSSQEPHASLGAPQDLDAMVERSHDNAPLSMEQSFEDMGRVRDNITAIRHDTRVSEVVSAAAPGETLPPCTCEMDERMPHFHLVTDSASGLTECRRAVCRSEMVEDGVLVKFCETAAGSSASGIRFEEPYAPEWCAETQRPRKGGLADPRALSAKD